MADPGGAARRSAWYHKERPTFVDALVRRALWRRQALRTSGCAGEIGTVPRARVEHLTETLRDGA
jgi:hypothetical protein